MTFLNFEHSYERLQLRLGDERQPGDAAFVQWLRLGRTVLTLQAFGECQQQVTNPALLASIKKPQEYDAKRRAFERGKLVRFVPPPQVWENLVFIRFLFRAAADKEARGHILPDDFKTSALLRRRYQDLLTLHRQEQMRRQHRDGCQDYETVAELGQGYKLYRIKTHSEAVREGQAMRNCLRELDMPLTRRCHPMDEYLRALAAGDLISMRGADGKSVATLRYASGLLSEIRGFGNGGLRRAHAMALRDYLLAIGTPLNAIAGEHVGVVRMGGAQRLYEEVLPVHCSQASIDVQAWPVTNADMAQLSDRHDATKINIIGCANLSCLPESILFQSPRHGIFVRRNQQKALTVAEANEYLREMFPHIPTCSPPPIIRPSCANPHP